MRKNRLAAMSLAALLMAGSLLAQSPEELAKRQYDSGMEFLRAGKFVEALRDFRAVADAYPASAVADDALLEVARYQLEIARDLDGAQTVIDTLLKKYGTADASPMGYVVAGRIALARGRQAEHIDLALAHFQRVTRLFPGTDAVPAAMVAHADTLRISGRCEEALEQYLDVASQYPRSAWAPPANVGASRCLVTLGRPLEALATLNRAQQGATGADEQMARALATILYRLYLRPPKPIYAFATAGFGQSSGRLKDVRAVAVGPREIYALTESGMAAHDLAKGTLLRVASAADARGLYLDLDGKPVIVNRSSLFPERGTRAALSTPRPDKTQEPIEAITAAAITSTGEILVANQDGPAVLRFGRDWKVIGPFTTARADRLIVGSLDQVAILDRAEKAVAIVNKEGKQIARVATKGTGWALDEPVDIAFDAFDHLYVLDKGLGSVLVYVTTPAVKLVAAFTLAERAAGEFRRATSFGLDHSGRLYIHDDKAERIQVYQ